MSYLGILIGGVAGFLYWKFVGCESGACPITSNKFISVGYGALLGSLLFSTIAGASVKKSFSGFFSGKDSINSHTNLSIDEMMILTTGLTDSNFILVDVRTPGEISNGYISGTDLFIDFSGVSFTDEIKKLDTTKKYIIYCRSGNRSSRACKIMNSKGFKNLYNLSGGINKWKGELKKD
ncbi:MAG: rhodanese-like domain-containing protein [Ignavibacteria bacterium]